MNFESIDRQPTPPRHFIPLDAACHLLTHGGTPRALRAAEMFITAVADSQGISSLETFVQVAAGKLAIDDAKSDVRLRRWRAAPDGALHVHITDVKRLGDAFDRWIKEAVPLGERDADTTVGPAASPAAVRYRADGPARCRELLAAMMRNEPQNGETKQTLRDRLTNELKISGRGFDAAWCDALVDAGAQGTWGMAGRRPNKKS